MEDQINIKRMRADKFGAPKRLSIFSQLSRKALILGGIIIIAILWLILSFIASFNSYKAVFLDNGQVYFGKFVSIPFTSNLTLRNVYYLKSTENSKDQTLASIENDVHQPTNKLMISKKHILYYEVLKPSSSLVTAIDLQEQKKNK